MDTPAATVLQMLGWIEANLDAPLTLERVAARAGYSPFHFARLFLSLTRRGVMEHVRGRRLVRAAHALLAEDAPSLTTLAADAGFGSQEAFTRAFRRTFGASPARFRRGHSLPPLEGCFPMTLSTADAADAVTLLSERRPRAALVVAGPSLRLDRAGLATIPQLWSRLLGALPVAGQVDSRTTYGVIAAADRAAGELTYLAGVAMAEDAPCPPGWRRMALAPATDAVFRIVLDGGPVHPQMKAAMAAIWGRLLPDAGLVPTDAPSLEVYDDPRPPSEPGATLHYHVPVAPA